MFNALLPPFAPLGKNLFIIRHIHCLTGGDAVGENHSISIKEDDEHPLH